MGTRPEFFVVDNEGEVYLGKKDAAEMAGVSSGYMTELVSGGRISSTPFSGNGKYVSLRSLVNFLLYERRPRGRPRKNR